MSCARNSRCDGKETECLFVCLFQRERDVDRREGQGGNRNIAVAPNGNTGGENSFTHPNIFVSVSVVSVNLGSLAPPPPPPHPKKKYRRPWFQTFFSVQKCVGYQKF